MKVKPTLIKNPQANSVLESIQQVLANMIRTFELQEQVVSKVDAWTGILKVVGWAVWSTHHTTLQASPG